MIGPQLAPDQFTGSGPRQILEKNHPVDLVKGIELDIRRQIALLPTHQRPSLIHPHETDLTIVG
jgi:hypothetical protein